MIWPWVANCIVVLISALFLLNYMYKKTNAYKNNNIYIKDYIKGVPGDLQIVNLGSTYSKFAFDNYEKLQLRGFNFALTSETLEMDYQILQQYADHIKPGATVIAAVAACLLLYRDETHTGQLMHYKILDMKRIPNISMKKYLHCKFPLIFHPKRISQIVYDKPEILSIYNTYPDYITHERMDKESEEMVGCWMDLFKLDNLKSDKLSEQNKRNIQKSAEELKKIVDFCKERGWTPVVVIPPFSEKLNQFFSQEFVDAVVRQPIRDILSRDALFLDYQWDDYFQDKPYLYLDGGFRLNEHGSQIFMRRIFTDLKKNGIIINNMTAGNNVG